MATVFKAGLPLVPGRQRTILSASGCPVGPGGTGGSSPELKELWGKRVGRQHPGRDRKMERQKK